MALFLYPMDFSTLRNYISDFSKKCDYDNDAIDTFLSTFDRIVKDDNLSRMFFENVEKYSVGESIKFKKIVGHGGITEKIANSLSISKYTTSFLFALCLVPALQKRYEKENIKSDIFYNSMLDLKYKLIECKKMYNVWGSFVTYWFDGWFDMTRFALGRLQFEPKNHCLITTKINSIRVNFGQKYVMIHIPSSGPLDHNEVLDSYKMAYGFFRERGYDENIVFMVSSWLLNPDHEKILDESSNIRKFMADYKRVLYVPEPKYEDFWRIFYRPYSKNLDGYPANTHLQKEYLKLITRGKHIKMGIGVFIYNKDGLKK